MENNYTYLKLIQSQNLTFWDVKSYNQQDIASQYKVEKLQNLLIEHTKKVKLFEKPEDDYKILGVNNQEGLFDAYIEKGKNINQPYKKVENGYFAYNPYRINVGSIGLKSDKQKYDYISPAYVVFSCKNDLYPQYLEILLKTKYFAQAIRHNTTGSVRQTLGFDNLCNISIPLPSIEKQKELVKEYEKLQDLIIQIENETKNIESSINEYLLFAHGYKTTNFCKKHTSNVYQGLKFVNYSQLNHWDYNFFFNPYKQEVEQTSFPLKSFGELCSSICSGKDARNYQNSGVEYLRVSNVRPGKLLLNDVKYIEKMPDNKNGKVAKGDFIITRKGSYGYAVYLDFIDHEYAICSEIFKIYLKENVNQKYLEYVFNSKIVQSQIENVKTRGIMGSINIPSLKSIQIPIPDIEIQQKIIQEVDARKNKINFLIGKSNDLKQQALSNFEKEVFN